ncbi:MAG: hypothetical protein NC416_16295 [Eubacterium sp.]|nr:hypothetical protein [Eubacterium sp.]
MLRNAFYNGEESAWQKALHVYCYGYTNGETNGVCESMIAWLEGKAGYERVSYARYWHGYLIILKPLLYFWDYGDIREFLKFIELSMLIYLCVMLSKRQLTCFIPAVAAAMMCIEFPIIGMSMQYSWVFIIAISFSIIILKGRLPVNADWYDMLFLVIGMMTSYFDFLTYPLFTLGFPLLVLVISRSDETENHTNFTVISIKKSVYWSIGYIGMWVQKWILCTIFTGENLVADGLQAILNRTGRNVDGKQIGYIETLWENIKLLCKYPYVLAVFIAAVLIFFTCRKKGEGIFSKWAVAAYLYVAILPFCWYAVSINHSYIHSFMTYRILGLTVFALLCVLTEVRSSKLQR